MGILDRMSTLIRANVNELLDRAEDPEKMLNQILRDMEVNIRQAREQVASMIAQEKELEADLNDTKKLSAEWGEKARRAVQAGKDDLAREALRRKKDSDETISVYEQQFATQQQTVTKLKQQLQALDSKYQSTMSQRDIFIARQRRAHAQQQVTESLSTFSPIDPSGDLDRMERKIRGSEAKAAAMAELADDSFDSQFKELDVDYDIEDQLAALKGGSSAGSSAAALSETAGAAAALPGSTGGQDSDATPAASSGLPN